MNTARRRRSATPFAATACATLFIGKSGAILLGFPDTTQDADLFVERRQRQRPAPSLAALREIGFALTDVQSADVERGQGLRPAQERPFDLDLVFAPDGIERFEDAWRRRVEIEGFPVCHIDDIIAGPEASIVDSVP